MSFILPGLLFATFAASVAALVVLYVLERDKKEFVRVRRTDGS